jgi:hypothetical protein
MTMHGNQEVSPNLSDPLWLTAIRASARMSRLIPDLLVGYRRHGGGYANGIISRLEAAGRMHGHALLVRNKTPRFPGASYCCKARRLNGWRTSQIHGLIRYSSL